MATFVPRWTWIDGASYSGAFYNINSVAAKGSGANYSTPGGIGLSAYNSNNIYNNGNNRITTYSLSTVFYIKY